MTSTVPPPETEKSPQAGDSERACSAAEGLLTLDSARIFGGRQEVAIRHNGRIYRLRRTRLGKLILTA